MKINFYLAVVAVFGFSISGCEQSSPDFSLLDPVPVEVNCDVTQLRDIPSDPGVRGPWPVGQKTVKLGEYRELTTEIWYPAIPGSEAFETHWKYDLRQFLPKGDAKKIPDSAELVQVCDCYPDLPIDHAFGPYPVIVLIHGTAGFRTASLSIATHWASRGFVVLSVDNPFIYLKDAKANLLGISLANQAQDTVDVIAALQNLPQQLSFLDGSIDTTRIGVAGHSSGGRTAAFFADAPGVRTVVPMASDGTVVGQYQKSSLILGSEKDEVVEYLRQQEGFVTSPAPKRLVGIAKTGHLAFTELCFLGAEQGGLIPLVESFGISVPSFFRDLGTDGCGDEFLSPEDGWSLINYATTAAFEEVLQCNAQSADAFENIQSRFPLSLFQYDELL